MDYKPDKQDLISYLYGEVDDGKREKIDKYLASSKEARRNFEELKNVTNILKELPDKEVLEPYIEFKERENPTPVMKIFRNSWIKPVLGIAASLILIMLVGYITNTTIRYSGNELKISFGSSEPVVSNQPVYITETELKSYSEELRGDFNRKLKNTEEKFQESIASSSGLKENELKRIVEDQQAKHQAQLISLVQDLQDQNLKILAEFIQESNQDQQEYVQTLLVDFTKYLENQRIDDLRLIEASLKDIKQDSELKYQETGQILATIINQVNAQNN